MSSPPSDLNVGNSTVTHHPLQDVDLNDTSLSSDNADVVPNNLNKKENWVKFDDDGSEGILGTSENNKVNNELATTAAVNAAATTNRLTPSPIPPPTNPKRHSTAVVGGAARSRTPTLESSQQQQQQLHTSQLDVTAVTPVQRTTSSTSSVVPDVAAPAVLNTESVHVNLNASGKAQQHQQQLNTQNQQQQQQQHQQQHYQKLKTLTSNSNNIVSSSLLTTSSNNTNSQQHHNHHQQYKNNQLPHHSNNGNMTNNSTANKLSSISSSTSTTTMATSQPASTGKTSVTIPIESQPAMRTIELSTGRIREGFANGDVIVTLLPANTKYPWVTPAIFRPELVPEELMAQGLTLTVEEYVHAMETLERGVQLFLRYASRWGRDAIRGLVDVTPVEPGRHCGQFQCPCQYIKDHLQCKPRGYPCGCIAYASDPQFQNRY